MLIPKRDRNILKVKCWRPLTMLAMDYKIISKALDIRLKKVIGRIIEDYQTGFMEGRNILTNVIKVMDIMDDSMRRKMNNILLAIDFEKCFDMVSHSAIKGAFHYFNFGSIYTDWVLTLFRNFQICAHNNGFISDWLTATRGLHQGCCISPHIFNLCGQIFANILEHNNKIDGITAHGLFILLAQFADDTNLFLKASDKTLREVTRSLALAEKNLGLRVNYQKTTIYRLGSLVKINATYYTQAGYRWSDPPVDILGIHITTNFKMMAEINLTPLLDTARNRIALWSRRNLSLTGRVLIINTFIESLFVYRFSVLPHVSEDFFAEMQQMINSYVWRSKRAKINFDIMKQPKMNGGLRLVDLHNKHLSLLIQWIFHKDLFVQTALSEAIGTPLGSKFWECNLHHKDLKQTPLNKESFWYGVGVAWCKFNYSEVETYEAVINQLLWYNSSIKIGGSLVFIKELHTAGINTVGNLLTNNQWTCWEQLCNINDVRITWLEYQGLLDAVPHRWKRIIHDKVRKEENYTSRYNELKDKLKITKIVYDKLVLKPCVLYGSLNRWNKTFGTTISYVDFEKKFADASKVTISTKLRDFQFRLLHKRLPTNRELHRWKMKSSDECNFCINRDNIIHTLYECDHIQLIWQSLPLLISKHTGIPIYEININGPNVIWNRIHAKPSSIANLYCLVLKQMIYRKKCENKKLTNNQFINEIDRIEKIEYYNTVHTSKVKFHMNKWKSYRKESNPM